MDGIALTTWLLVQLAFDSRPSMNEGLRQSQDDIGFRQFGNPAPTEGLLRSQYALIVDARRLRNKSQGRYVSSTASDC